MTSMDASSQVTGPLRSIQALHVAFQPLLPSTVVATPSNATNENVTTSASAPDLQPHPSTSLAPSVSQGAIPGDRRHQIPGLRQTPYLKVLFIRCDDSETYKATIRQTIRDWLRDNTQSSSKASSQENHDAFEWLIVHVIVPNTVAATQPRLSGKFSDIGPTSPLEKPVTARWRGAGSSTIFERLRADFGASSKSDLDRLAQIRIGINDVPYDLLPRVVPAIPGTYVSTPQDHENSWLDLVKKLKALILSSFDSRVGQYEEDIRDRDRQRHLPGWNFCTFFVLKEGLARGFETVGLVEDALATYDELAVGLDAIVEERAAKDAKSESSYPFLEYTEDLRAQAQDARKTTQDKDKHDGPHSEKSLFDLSMTDSMPLRASRKLYREAILSNNISLFDFRCYVFTRQMSLLIRLAGLPLLEHVQNKPSLPRVITTDTKYLVELCTRALQWIPMISRILREDLLAAWLHDDVADRTRDAPIAGEVSDNMIASFVFNVVQQVLIQTQLVDPDELGTGMTLGARSDGESFMLTLPVATAVSNRLDEEDSVSQAISAISSLGLAPPDRPATASGLTRSTPVSINQAAQSLAAQQANLLLLLRSVIERVIKRVRANEKMSTEQLNPPKKDAAEVAIASAETFSNMIASVHMEELVHDQQAYDKAYEWISVQALLHYKSAGYMQSMQACMLDLAKLKFSQGDLIQAAKYFGDLAKHYEATAWDKAQMSMLLSYARCLKALDRNNELMDVLVKLIRNQSSLGISIPGTGYTAQVEHTDQTTLESLLRQLLDAADAGSVGAHLRIPLEAISTLIVLGDSVIYADNTDKLSLKVKINSRLKLDLKLQKLSVKLTQVQCESPHELWLETLEEHAVYTHGANSLVVHSKSLIPGLYAVTELVLRSAQLTFYHRPNDRDHILAHRNQFLFKSSVLRIYRPPGSFEAEIHAAKHIKLNARKSLDLKIFAGRSNIVQCELSIKAATAGLRLQLGDVTMVDASAPCTHDHGSGTLTLGSLKAHSCHMVTLPFNVEQEVTEVSVRIDIKYISQDGEHRFISCPTVPIMLPLGVNVQDFFRHDSLMSKFAISTSGKRPLRLLNSRLEGNGAFTTDCGLLPPQPIAMFNRQPASMLYRIKHSNPNDVDKIATSNAGPLSLTIHYVSVQEEVEHVVSQSLKTALQEEGLATYCGIVAPMVMGELKATVSSLDLEHYLITGSTTTLLPFEIRWIDRLSGLGGPDGNNVAHKLASCLLRWQQRLRNADMQFTTSPTHYDDLRRSITIPVDVPSVSVVHTASLVLRKSTQNVKSPPVGIVNRPMLADLKITWSRLWDNSPVSETSTTEAWCFSYEVLGSHEAWLIGGRRKGRYLVDRQSPQATQALLFPISLMPLKDGILPYPAVEIRAVVASSHGLMASKEPNSSTVRDPPVTSEVDYRNAGQTLRVVSNAWKTTLSLDTIGPYEEGAWLLDTQERATPLVV